MTHLEKLDFILKIISKKKDFIFSQDIFKNNQNTLERGELGMIINKLVLDNLVEKKIDDNSTSNKVNPPFFCRLSYSGILFLEKGGYVAQDKREKKQRAWIKTKNIANRLNTTLVLILAVVGVYASWESKIKEAEIKKQEKIIDSLNIVLKNHKSITLKKNVR